MQFEISERIDSSCDLDKLLELTNIQFGKIAKSTRLVQGKGVEAKGIEATFGSINRLDTTEITAKQLENGWLLSADVHYRPSLWFWIFVLLGIGTYVGWAIPIAFYFYHKSTVKSAAITALQRIANELRGAPVLLSKSDSLADLERLAQLKERGILTEDEFQAKKAQILQT